MLGSFWKRDRKIETVCRPFQVWQGWIKMTFFRAGVTEKWVLFFRQKFIGFLGKKMYTECCREERTLSLSQIFYFLEVVLYFGSKGSLI